MPAGLTRLHLRDIMEIMSVPEEMVPLLASIRCRSNVMNPWVRQLPGIFRGLHLQKGIRCLDIPCGEGGVSVPLARNYGVGVTGFDLFPHFVRQANDLAKARGVEALCRFRVGDIRDVVRRRGTCDLLLWFAAPRIWGGAEATIRALRRRVKHGGWIVIGDGYAWSEQAPEEFRVYGRLEEASRGYASAGDDLVRVVDYGRKLWGEDYRLERKHLEDALRRLRDARDRKVLGDHLRRLAAEERTVSSQMGTAIWMLKVRKR